MSLTCENCHREVDGAFVCVDCLDTLHGDLAAIPDLVRELHVELVNQSRKGSGSRSRGSERGLPYSVQASALLSELRTELVGACRLVALDDPARMPADSLTAMAAWLDRHLASVGQREGGGEVCTGMGRLVRRIRRAIDTPPERRYIGDCATCTDDGKVSPMYASHHEALHRCRECGTTYGVAESIEGLEMFLRDYRLTAAEVEVATGGRVRSARVRKWRQRGRIEADFEGKVRFGDVLDLEARAS